MAGYFVSLVPVAMRSYIQIFIGFLSMFTLTLAAQGWEKVYQGITSEFQSGWRPSNQNVVATSDSGFVFIGYKADSLILKGYLTKINREGEILWTKSFYHKGSYFPLCLAETPDQDFIIGGYVVDTSTNSSCAFLTKTNSSGLVIWTKIFPSTAEFGALKCTMTGIIAGGYTTSTALISLAKVDYDGNLIWSKVYDKKFFIKSIEVADNDGVVVLARGDYGSWGDGLDCSVLRIDNAGNLLWAKNYGYNNSFDPNVIKKTNDGGYVIAGSILMRIDSLGNLIWVNGYQSIIDLVVLDDNSFMSINNGQNFPVQLSKISSDGYISTIIYFGDNDKRVVSILKTFENDYLITGVHSDFNSEERGIYIIRTDSNGLSGCNSQPVVNSNSNFPGSLCIVKDIQINSYNVNSHSSIQIFQANKSLSVLNRCCSAKPVVTHTYYPCLNDTIEYTVAGGPSCLWSTGDTTFSIRTMDTVVQVSIANTCGVFTDTISVQRLFTPTFTYSLNNNSICAGDSVILVVNGNAPAYTCNWYDVPSSVYKRNDSTFILKPETTCKFYIDAYTNNHGPNCNVSDTFLINVEVNKPVISVISDVLISNINLNNQWYLNGQPIQGATDQSYEPVTSGMYSVGVTNGTCSNQSDEFYFLPDSLKYRVNGWSRVFETGNFKSEGMCIVQTPDGGSLVAARVYNEQYDENISFVKTDKNGEIQWTKTYGGKWTERISSLIGVSGGFIAAGYTKSFGNGNADAYILKLDEAGSLIWSKTYGDWNNQAIAYIEQTADGSFIITGYTSDPDTFTMDSGWIANETDLYVFKIDSNGDLIWNKTYDTGHGEFGAEIHETASGELIVSAGVTDPTYYQHVFLLKLDEIGNVIWSKKIRNSFFASVSSMKITADNNYLICAGASGKSYVLKINSDGNVVWSKTYSTGSWPRQIEVLPDSSAIFLVRDAYPVGSIVKIGADGSLIWSQTLSSDNQYKINEFKIHKDGGILLTGAFDTLRSFINDKILLIKTDPSGKTNCNYETYPVVQDEPADYVQHSVIMSSLGTMRNASTEIYTVELKGSIDCGTYKRPNEINEQSTRNCLEVFPNPTRGLLNLKLSCEAQVTYVNVRSILGDIIITKKIQSVKESFMAIDLSGCSKGVYLIEVITGSSKMTRKIILN